MIRYNGFKYILILIMLAAALQPVFSQDTGHKDKIRIIEESYLQELPIWLLMERGKQAFDLGEYGLASRVFREVLDRETVYPDADLWLAYIFIQEGEYLLAEKQYLKAYANKAQLYIHEDEFTILYGLAEIYRKTDQYRKYEETLLQIIDKDDESMGIMKLQYSMLDVLKESGVDKMFELYRYTNNKYNRARLELGVFYYRTGRYTEAEINLILPVVSIAATGFDYIYNKTAVYEFTGVDAHINRMTDYPELSVFIEQNNLFETIYYLAASLYADGYYSVASDLWRLVYDYDFSGSTWKIRALRQLESPFIEPIITNRS